jgi:hypothetical protein
MVHDAVRIASVVNAAAAALDAEPSGANVG